MPSRFFTFAACTVLSIAAASAVSSSSHLHAKAMAVPGNARLHAFGSRSARQSRGVGAKYDAALAELARHASQARPDHAIDDLRAMAPALRFKPSTGSGALVLIDATSRGDPAALKAALEALGLERSAMYSNDVSGWLPVAELDAAAARAEVGALRAALPRARSGAVTSQGDSVQRSGALRSGDALTGAGVTVGVLSDSFDCYSVFAANGVPASGASGYASNGFLADAAKDVASGDLSSGVNVLAEAECMDGSHYNGYPLQLPFADEGRAMLQVVHDVAPGAKLAFYTAENGEADFANGILALAAAGAKVIAEDVGYFDEAFYQDGVIAQAVDRAASQYGVTYFSAAGNDGTLAYENTSPTFSAVSTTGPNAGEHLLNFDASGATSVTALPVTAAALVPGEFVAIVVEWDQPYVTGAPNSGGATSQIDVCITGASGADEITDYDGNSVTCTGPNALGSDPYQIMIVANPANAAGNTAAEPLHVVVGLAGGAVPGRIKVAVEDDGAGSTIDALPGASHGATLQGHPGAASAAAVGAAFFFHTPGCGTSPAALESYSSEGGAPLLFDSAGVRLSTPVVRQKPDFVGPDGGNDTFLGFTLASAGYAGGRLSTSTAACQNDPAYPNYFGTSAAAPHVAGIAALMLQANPSLTSPQILQALRASALPMGSSTPNFDSGYGFVQADAAFAAAPQVSPPAPTLTASSDAVSAGNAVTLEWSAVNAKSCTASGSWSGSLATSGSQSVTPSAAGTDTYTLSCSNGAGTSPATSASVKVAALSTAAASAGHGGGGATTFGLLMMLAGMLWLGRLRASRLRRLPAPRVNLMP